MTPTPYHVLRVTLVGAGLLVAGTLAHAMSPRADKAANNLSIPPSGQVPFPDFGFMVEPAQYTGPIFRLSQDYPASLPAADRIPAFFQKLPATLSPDFSLWRDYMLAVRDYCFEGNIPVDWRVQENPVRTWYHIPWQHYGPAGREGIRGLTKEAPVQVGQLAATQGRPNPTDLYQTYAVGFFNEFGGYTIGRVWADRQNPNPALTTRPEGGFPVGTVISKLLFVDVPVEQVPSLVNPIQWQGYIQQAYKNPVRSIRSVALIQMDIAVRDDRAPTGWLFGTFQYNGALDRANPWENLIPVGIMWGNDPAITDDTYTNIKPTVTKINPALKETSINPDPAELPPTHLGWNGRLNGPVDNPLSSCISCHMTAEVPTLSPLNPTFQDPAKVPARGSEAWMRWFQNIKCGVPFDAEAQSTDFGLQLAMGIENFLAWKATQAGLFASDYKTPPPPRATNGKPMLKSAPAAGPKPGPRRYPIVRDVVPDESDL